MERLEKHWWESWVSPQVVAALIAGGTIVYAAGGKTASTDAELKTLSSLVNDLRVNVATKAEINALPGQYATRESVAVLQAQFISYQAQVSDKLNGISAQVASVQQNVGEISKRAR